jgi:hypothetical protein
MRRVLVALAMAAAAPTVGQTPLSSAGSSPATYIYAGTLLDRPGQSPRGNSTIIVRSGKVAEIREGFVPAEAGAKLIDLRNSFVLPGLIDMHVHLWGIGGDPMREQLEAMTRDGFDNEMTAVANARVTLEAGFTSVRDLGGDPRGIRALRDAVDAGIERAFISVLREEAMVMAEDRSTWHLPPIDTLFVQRKVSGTALLCARLKARVDVRGMIERYSDASLH